MKKIGDSASTPEWSLVDSYVGNFSSPSLTYHRPCPICGSVRSRVVTEMDDFQFYTDSVQLPKRVDLRENQCLECFALYKNPCYTDFGFQVLFAEAGQSYGSSEGRPDEQIHWLSRRGLLNSGKQILDAGCHEGEFLSRLPDTVRKVGVDIDVPAVERGRKRFGGQGIDFVLGDFENFQINGTPDTITMIHVLEHLPRPVAVLRNLCAIANQDTRLVIEVPILENGITKDINGFFSVQHLTHFSRRSLKNCLLRSGWRITEMVEQESYNGCRILAEPCETKHTVIPAFDDTQSLYNYLAAWYQALNVVEIKMRDLVNASRCVIWGGGAHTELLYHKTTFFFSKPDRDLLVVDSDPIKHGKSWRGVMISEPSVLKEVEWAQTILVVSSYGSQEAIRKAAIDIGVPAGRIVSLYDETRIY